MSGEGDLRSEAVADPNRGAAVKISHKKDGRRKQPPRFHVSCPPPHPAAGSATVMSKLNKFDRFGQRGSPCTVRALSNASWVVVIYEHPTPGGQTDTTINITFATPLAGGNDGILKAT